jgi:predicted nucleic acid-binding protein
VSQIVVSDSTCLIALERIRRLDLLPAVFGQIWIPPAVAAEFGESLPWLLVRAPANVGAVAAYAALVDAGEAAAIALAAELKCEVILDDLQARRLAAREGVPCVGLLGVLLRAKQGGQLVAVRPLIDALRERNFHVSAALVAEALRLAGE